MKKIKVLQMPIANSQGGLTQYVLQNWKFIDKEKFQFDFVTLSKTLDFADELIADGCKIHYLSCSSMQNEVQFITEIKKILDEDYDVIHLHTSYWNGILVEKLAKEYGCPKIIVHAHSTMVDIADNTLREKAINEHIKYKISFPLEYATHYVACSKMAADWLFGEHIPRERVQILNNAIDTKRFAYSKEIRESYRKQLNIQNCYVIGHVGRFSYSKNHKMILEIFRGICKVKSNARLMLVGDGPLKADVQNKAEEYGIADKILFLGRREDTAQLMQAMDIFILPSRFEGLGLVLIEAQTAGLKCLANNCLPLESNITSNITYLPDSIDSWIDEIIKYSKGYDRFVNKELIEKAGFSLEQQIKTIEQLYKN